MDNITHTLVGVALANAGLSKRFGRGTTLALAVASNLPDVDGLCLFLGPEGILLRRTLTHSVFGVVALSAAAAWLLGLRYRQMGTRSLFGLCLLGAALHVVFDLLNSFGVELFSPVSDRRFELAWVFIVDLALTGLLVAPFMFASSRRQLEIGSRGSLIAAAAYLLFCGVGHARAETLIDASPDFSYAFPEAGGSHRFRGVVRRGSEYREYLIRPWGGSVEPGAAFSTVDREPDARAIRETPRARKLEHFFKAPVWRRASSGEFEVFDLRFHSTVLDRSPLPFTFRFGSGP